MKIQLKIITLLLLIHLPTAAIADHILIDQLTMSISNDENLVLFNGSPREKVKVSYSIYIKGGISREGLIVYWNRVYDSSSNAFDTVDIINTITKVDDSNVCVVQEDNLNNIKVNFLDICI